MYASVLAPIFYVPRNWAATNAGTPAAIGEAVLRSYTVPAGFFGVIGRRIEFEFSGTFANNANNKTIRLRLGPVTLTGTVLFTSTVNAYTNLAWRLKGSIYTRITDSQSADIKFLSDGGAVATAVQMPNGMVAAANDDAAAMLLECTGENAAASANDIVCNNFKIQQIFGAPQTEG